jgi:hypothetical protein
MFLAMGSAETRDFLEVGAGIGGVGRALDGEATGHHFSAIKNDGQRAQAFQLAFAFAFLVDGTAEGQFVVFDDGLLLSDFLTLRLAVILGPD